LRTCAACSARTPTREYDMESEPDLILEDAASLREATRRLARYASDAAEALDARIEGEDLDGNTEALELREALERIQDLSLEISEQLDAYQDRHAR
jgi:hypothetical protein